MKSSKSPLKMMNVLMFFFWSISSSMNLQIEISKIHENYLNVVYNFIFDPLCISILNTLKNTLYNIDCNDHYGLLKLQTLKRFEA